jgi:hypothetical protein
MACWEFHRGELQGPERWTWRALDSDGSVRLSAQAQFPSLNATMRNAALYGFENDRDEWYIGKLGYSPCQNDKRVRRRNHKS